MFRSLCRLGRATYRTASKPVLWFAFGLLYGIVLTVPLSEAEARSGEAQRILDTKIQAGYEKGYEAGWNTCWEFFMEQSSDFWVYPIKGDPPKTPVPC